MTFLILKKRKVCPLLEEDSPLYRRNATSLTDTRQFIVLNYFSTDIFKNSVIFRYSE